MNDCSKYWAFADFLPLSQVVEYWCQKSGYRDPHCVEAKKAAIVAQCASGAIRYGRSDGKTFTDPPHDLAGRGLLTIERESFDAWVEANFEPGTPLPRPVPRDSSLIATIAALLFVWPGGAIPSGKDLERAAQSLGLTLSDDTIRKALKAAQEAAPSLPLPK
jgi:hypothetical protein